MKTIYSYVNGGIRQFHAEDEEMSTLRDYLDVMGIFALYIVDDKVVPLLEDGRYLLLSSSGWEDEIFTREELSQKSFDFFNELRNGYEIKRDIDMEWSKLNVR